MSEVLPAGWEACSIADVTTEIDQRAPAADKEFFYVDIASVDREEKMIVSPQKLIGADAPSRARKVIRAGDVLVSMTRPNLNAVALVGHELDGEVASTGFDVLRARHIDSRWLYYIVRSKRFVDAMSGLVQGALYPAVKSKDVRSYRIPLAPLAEQKRIADKLDAVLARVDACRARLDRVPAVLKRFRQAVLAAGLSGVLTEEWRKKTQISQEDWQRSTLGKASALITKGASPNWQGIAYIENNNGTLFVTSENIGAGRMLLEKRKYVENTFNDKQKRSVLRAGDVLTNIVGASIGRTAIYDGVERANINQAVCLIRTDPKVLVNAFLMHFLNSSQGIQALMDGVVEVARANVSLNTISNIPITLPGLDEQLEIVRRIETLFTFAERLEARFAAARNAADRLTPALLAKAFRGELVPQDPADEPAAKLLKRLATSRGEATPKAARARKAA